MGLSSELTAHASLTDYIRLRCEKAAGRCNWIRGIIHAVLESRLLKKR